MSGTSSVFTQAGRTVKSKCVFCTLRVGLWIVEHRLAPPFAWAATFLSPPKGGDLILIGDVKKAILIIKGVLSGIKAIIKGV